jgi:HPt (histidine-containing phosphotransfer) domain-containing protein
MSTSFEETLRRLRGEFVDNCIDKLDFIDIAIDTFINEPGKKGENFSDFQREIHSIKGSAGTHGFNSVSTIAHRLEDYVESTRRLSGSKWLEVQKFVDAIREIIESREELSADQTDAVMNSLPTSALPTLETIQGKRVTVLLVMPMGVQRKLVGLELASIGFDVSFIDTPTQAIQVAFAVKPHAILSSQELSEFSGSELAAVFKAIKATSKIPFIILTSHKKDSMPQSGAANDVYVINKSEEFLQKLSELLLSLDLFRRA